MSDYQNIQNHFKKIHSYEHALSIIYWDSATFMPPGGQAARSESIAELGLLVNQLRSSDELGEMIDKVNTNDLSDIEKRNIALIKKSYRKLKLIPDDLSKALSKATSDCEFQWRTHRKENDFANFRPLLENVVNLSKEYGQIIADEMNCTAYDALLDKFQEGVGQGEIDKLFGELKTELPNLLDDILSKQTPAEIPQGHYPDVAQKELGQSIMSDIGLDFNAARLDVSVHPFCGGVEEDVRLTTRYNNESFVEALMGIIHETGHACYNQNLPKDLLAQPVGRYNGMATHEAQSLFYEMQMGRSLSFWKRYSSLAKEKLSQFTTNNRDSLWDAGNLFKIYTQVDKGFIRVAADEVTYPFHVILRYEIERDLIEGKIEVKDLPEVWNTKMQDYLGLSTKGNDKDGCMQDVHWPSGLFGYFPSYTLGALFAAQMKDALTKNLNMNAEIENGNFAPIIDWLKVNIWEQGSIYTFDELVTKSTGRPLGTESFLSHVKERYLN